ncbi:hypothetical protein L7F22_011056 [Adiantum nelumboides]|nr:hypothetical protein [Adiantum nelumboides]
MSLLGARVSLASAWNSHGSSHFCSSPKAHASPVQCAKALARSSEASTAADKGRSELLSIAEHGFNGSFRREGVQKGTRIVMASASVAQPYSGVQEEGVVQEPMVVPGTDLSSIIEWELDFCSRPILDSRGKRLWELLICDSNRNLQFAKFFPNNVINSVTLKDAMLSVTQLGLPRPQKVRFFR